MRRLSIFFDKLVDSDEVTYKVNGEPIFAKHEPGRPRKPENEKGIKKNKLAPSSKVVAEQIRQRNGLIDNDPILEIARSNEFVGKFTWEISPTIKCASGIAACANFT